MVMLRLDRRAVLAGMGALGLSGGAAAAREFVDLNWTDLVPEGQPAIPPVLQSMIQHDGPDLSGQQPPSQGVRTDWNGQTVRLPGFMIPLDFSGVGVTTFILVPFVGACIHVPPPPANQLVFVTTNDPFESAGMFDAVRVVGRLDTASMTTQLADIAYAMAADKITKI